MTETGSGWGSPLTRSPSLSEHSSGAMAHDSNITDCYHRNEVVSFSPATPCRSDAFRNLEDNQESSDSEFEFEFAVPGIGAYSSPISADEIFQNGQIMPLFPVFNTPPAEICPVRLPLIKLMITERETTLTESVSCSCSETDDLEGVAPETYCVWTPSKNAMMMRKNSQSAGSSKRWKFRDFLYRSHSDGNGDALEFLTTKPKNDQKMKKKENVESNRKMSYLIGWFC